MSQTETLSVKRIPFYLLLILIGFLLAYIIGLVRSSDTKIIRVDSSAELIPDSLAKKFIEAYQADQRKLPATYQLVSAADTSNNLRGFWITKSTLEDLDKAIEKNNPKAKIVGYSLFLGKANPQVDKRAYNLVIRGSLLIRDEKAATARSLLHYDQFEDSEEAAEMIDPIIN